LATFASHSKDFPLAPTFLETLNLEVPSNGVAFAFDFFQCWQPSFLGGQLEFVEIVV
jgi:hypothetical protein